MLLITSGAYVSPDLAYEFGQLPPAMLPVGNKRLYEHQIFWAKRNKIVDIYLSLPASYELSSQDASILDRHKVEIICVPDDLSLGQSIAFSWSTLLGKFKELTILHGDTLIPDLDAIDRSDLFAIAKNEGYYHRGVLTKGHSGGHVEARTKLADEKSTVFSGFFSFSNGFEFVKCLYEARLDFVRGVEEYSKKFDVALQESSQWFDFGHLVSYFQSRVGLTTQRSFNGLKISRTTVLKSSSNVRKMRAEYGWFRNIPSTLREFAPNVYWYEETPTGGSYSLEYLYCSSLADLFVFSEHPADTWDAICLQLHRFKKLSSEASDDSLRYDVALLDNMYLSKTLSRLNEYSTSTGLDLHESFMYEGFRCGSLSEIARITAASIRNAQPSDVGVVHGDLCFSNVMFDFRSGSIKLIDPRGINSLGEETIFGDIRYDLAKIMHSVIGLYDLIIAGRFTYNYSDIGHSLKFYEDERIAAIQSIFTQYFFESPIKYRELMAMTIHLFLSMLPLHSDNQERQRALMANALRLYSKFFSEGHQ